MILRIDERLFQDRAVARPLAALLRRLEGREDAVLPWPENRDVGPGSIIGIWIDERQDADERQLFRTLFEYGPIIEASIPERPDFNSCHQPKRWRRSGPLDVRVVPGDVSDWRSLDLTIHDAADLVSEPVHLYLENDLNDYAFLRLLSPPTKRSELEGLYDSPARMQTHSGGTGALQSHFRTLAQASILSAVQLRRLWRTWVLFDRDAATADARITAEPITALIENLETIYRVHGVPITWICLQRREIESYVPDAGLRALRPEHRYPFVDSIIQWRRGGPRQDWAWAFDMKNGLLGDLTSTVTPERRRELMRRPGAPELVARDLKPPFNALSAPDRRKLRNALGSRWFTQQLNHNTRPVWTEEIGTEYDRGPDTQIPRTALVQSLFDRA